MKKWTDEMIEFARENAKGREVRELRQMINDKFGTDFSKSAIVNMKNKYGIKSGLNFTECGTKYQYRLYAQPYNKGRKISAETREKIKGTFFKKGRIPATVSPLYTIRKKKNNGGKTEYTMIKIKETRYEHNNWQQYQRYIWEKEKGEKLTSNDVIIFIDGNNDNFDINNLVKLTRGELAILNHCYPLGHNAEENKTKILMAKINAKRHQIARENGLTNKYGQIQSDVDESHERLKKNGYNSRQYQERKNDPEYQAQMKQAHKKYSEKRSKERAEKRRVKNEIFI